MKKGFTLSEVLIALAIIGIVAVLTLPTFLQKHQRNVFVTQLKKNYADLSLAFQKALVDGNAPSVGETNIFQDGGETFLKKYFKVVDTCKNSDTTRCIDFSKYRTIGDGPIYITNDMLDEESFTCSNLANGSTLCLTTLAEGGDSFTCAIVDVNGAKDPNIAARDLFVMLVDNDGKVVPFPSSDNPYGRHGYSGVNEFSGFQYIYDDGWQMNY